MLTSIALVWLCEYFYQKSPHKAIHLTEFQSQIIKKEELATATLNTLKNVLIHSTSDSLIHYNFPDNDISYYQFNQDELVYWSDNHIDIEKLEAKDTTGWHFAELPNAYCITKSIKVDSQTLLAVMAIKYNYPYENENLINNFSKDFNLDKRIEIKSGNPKDKYAVFDSRKQYLFSLNNTDTPVYSNFWGIAGFSLSIIFLGIFFFVYANSPKLL